MISTGSCYQHKRHGEEAVPKFTNVSKVTNYIRDAGGIPGDPRAPYGRGNRTNAAPPFTCAGYAVPAACQPHASCDEGANPNSNPKCCPWPVAERPASAGAGQVLIDYNVYQRIAAETLDLSACLKIGHKLVQARKVHHGRYGYSSVDAENWGPLCNQCGCAGSDYKGYQPNADQVRYLKQHAVSTYVAVVVPDTTQNLTATCTRDYSVNRYSGIKTQNTCTDAGDASGIVSAKVNLGTVLNPIATLIEVYCEIFTEIYDHFTETHPGGNLNVFHAEIFDSLNVKLAEADLNLNSMTSSRKRFPADPLDKDELNMEIGIASLHWKRLASSVSGANRSTITSEVTASLSVPYSSDALLFDLYIAMAAFAMDDDKVYPWRTDDALHQGAIVYYNEVPGPVAPSFEDCAWTGDPNAVVNPDGTTYEPLLNRTTDSGYDGSLRGQPLPAGYGPHFDFGHLDWVQCAPGEWYPTAFGQNNAGSPRSATRWTERQTSQPCSAGAWLRYTTGGVLWGQKIAEAIAPRPAYNWFGPWGKARYALDEPRTGCVTASVGSPAVLTVAFEVTPTGPTAIATNTLCYYGGKIWQVTRNTDTEYVLTTEKFTVPAAAQPTDGAAFGPLRFPSAWAIGGRVRVLAATQAGANVNVTIASPGKRGDGSWLRAADTVDFSGIAGLGTGVVIGTVTDLTHIIVPGTLSGAYSSGGYLKSTGAPSHTWFSTQRKGDYVTFEWRHDFRDFQEADGQCARRNYTTVPGDGFCVCDNDGHEAVTCAGPTNNQHSDVRYGQASRSVKTFIATQRRHAPSACDPIVACWSPPFPDVDNPGSYLTHAEKFTAGDTYLFPTSFICDSRYGSLWQAAIVQNIPDPLWQPPHKSCAAYTAQDPDSFAFNWIEDALSDGATCLPDADPNYYYAHRPYVEAVLAVPGGAPALPSGITLGYTIATAPPPSLTEGAGGVSDTSFPLAPWAVWLRQRVCVDAVGRFHEQYEQNGIAPS